MSKKVLVIIIIITLLLLGVFAFFIFTKDGNVNNIDRAPGGNFFGNLFPFGGGDSGDRSAGDPTKDADRDDIISDGEDTAAFQLRQLTTEAVAGAMVISSDETIKVLYLERPTGNIYEINLQNLERNRLTNTTVIGVHETVWHNDGEKILLRYLNENDVIKTFAGSITNSPDNETEDTGQLDGVFLEDDISYITASPDKTEILLLLQNKTGISFVTAEFDGGNQEPVFTSPFSEWLPQWFKDSTVSVTTKASALASGFLYFVDLRTGVFEKVIGDIAGLTTLVNTTGEMILYSKSGEDRFTLNTLIITERIKSQLPVSTLPEKCVWSTIQPSVAYCGVPITIIPGDYPDIWYQGLISFSDNIWEIDVKRNTVKLLASPSTIARDNIDIVNLLLSDEEEYLIFTNKKDSTLWSLTLP